MCFGIKGLSFRGISVFYDNIIDIFSTLFLNGTVSSNIKPRYLTYDFLSISPSVLIANHYAK